MRVWLDEETLDFRLDTKHYVIRTIVGVPLLMLWSIRSKPLSHQILLVREISVCQHLTLRVLF